MKNIPITTIIFAQSANTIIHYPSLETYIKYNEEKTRVSSLNEWNIAPAIALLSLGISSRR